MKTSMGLTLARHAVTAPLLLASGLLALLSGCESLRVGLDSAGLDHIGKRLATETLSESPEALEAFLGRFEPFGLPLADPALIKREHLDRWSMRGASYPDLVEERLSFPSPLGDRAVFYLYHRGPLRGQKAILWVPGYGVSDTAFPLIRGFFGAALDEGYSILFYTLPFHLERAGKGRAAGEGLLSIDTGKNLMTLAAALAELRSGLSFLRAEGAEAVSGWGGSMGAALLWTLSSRERFEHLCLLIPVVDWTTIVFSPHLRSAMGRLEASGYDSELIGRAYAYFSPSRLTSLTAADNIELLYAREDQLTPEAATLEFARKQGIRDVKGYEESHGTMLLDPQIYKDYAHFLERVGKPLAGRAREERNSS